MPKKLDINMIGETAPAALLMRRRSVPVVDPRYSQLRKPTLTQLAAKAQSQIPALAPDATETKIADEDL
jgi:hypothetical protein